MMKSHDAGVRLPHLGGRAVGAQAVPANEGWPKLWIRVVLLALGLLTCFTGRAVANPVLGPAPGAPAAIPGPPEPFLTCGPVEITESVDNATVTAGNSVACNAGGVTAENSYYRAFDLAAFGLTSFSACEVQIGIELAQGGGGSGAQPLTVNLYANFGAPFPAGFPVGYSIIGTSSVSVPDQALTIFQIPVTGVMSFPGELVVEVFIANSVGGAGNRFWIGSNNLGETAPSYLRAPGCGIPIPTTLGSLGFPGMQIVMNVEGSEAAPAPAPALGSAGLVAGSLALIGVAVLAWRRRGHSI